MNNIANASKNLNFSNKILMFDALISYRLFIINHLIKFKQIINSRERSLLENIHKKLIDQYSNIESIKKNWF